MKIAIYFSLAILPFIATYSSAQSEHTTHWYFGNNAGLDFSSGTPVAIGSSGMKAREGSASYSDQNGNLLFYSNGVSVLDDTAAVWNSNNQIMPNGFLTDSTGYASTMQSSIVVPLPGSNTQYYLFTLDGFESYNTPEYKGLTYSIIDMSLDGGLGDVLNKATPIISPAIPFLSEQMTATPHANGIDYWLILHESNNINLTTNKFILFQISLSGIGSPITQNIGFYGSPGMQSTLQVSSQGDKLAFNKEVFDFNNSTGVLSNPVSTGTTGYREFSRDGRFLYVAKWDDGLYQFDLDAVNVSGSAYLLYSYNDFGQIQIGLDNKIYVAMQFDGGYQPYLSVINNPGQQGASSGFTMNAIDLVDGVSMTGLPNFIDFVPEGHNGIIENSPVISIALYPNPATSSVTLKFNSEEPLMATLVDVQGKVVVNKTQVLSGNNIDLSLIQSGNYFVKMELSGDVHWKRLTVE
jgi:hypothetical protein